MQSNEYCTHLEPQLQPLVCVCGHLMGITQAGKMHNNLLRVSKGDF